MECCSSRCCGFHDNIRVHCFGMYKLTWNWEILSHACWGSDGSWVRVPPQTEVTTVWTYSFEFIHRSRSLQLRSLDGLYSLFVEEPLHLAAQILILSRVRVTIDGVCIGNWINEHLQKVTVNNYDSLTELHAPKIAVTRTHMKSSQFVARWRILTMSSASVFTFLPADDCLTTNSLLQLSTLSRPVNNISARTNQKAPFPCCCCQFLCANPLLSNGCCVGACFAVIA
jgi:hypothetical protein